MFDIEYYISNNSLSNVESLSETDLWYKFLPGGIKLITENKEVNMLWDWIPLFDFALRLKEISVMFSNQAELTKVFEFTESEETLKFIKHSNSVQIVPSFCPAILDLSLVEFLAAINTFYNSLKEFILKNIVDKKISVVLERYLLD
jgi:hypothetical protein